MPEFILYSIIASVVLTLALNFIPRLFPNASRRMMDRFQERIDNQTRQVEDGNKPKVQFFFPWKFMILASIILTIFLNLGRLSK